MFFFVQNYIVRLESSLSKAAYEYSTIEYYFQANTSFKHFTFKFEPKVRFSQCHASRIIW